LISEQCVSVPWSGQCPSTTHASHSENAAPASRAPAAVDEADTDSDAHASNASRSSGQGEAGEAGDGPGDDDVGLPAGAIEVVLLPLAHESWHGLSNRASNAQLICDRIWASHPPHGHVRRLAQMPSSMSPHSENVAGKLAWMHPEHSSADMPAASRQSRTLSRSSGHECEVGAGLAVGDVGRA
jgi:hypothetical protein